MSPVAQGTTGILRHVRFMAGDDAVTLNSCLYTYALRLLHQAF